MDKSLDKSRIDKLLKGLTVDADAHRKDKDISIENVCNYAKCLSDLLKIVQEAVETGSGVESEDNVLLLKKVIPPLVITVSAHTGRHYWTNRETRKLAHSILNHVVILCGCNSVAMFLLGVSSDHPPLVSPYTPIPILEEDMGEEFPDPLPPSMVDDNHGRIVFKDGVLKHVLVQLRQELRKDNWKSHPNSKQALVWSIKHLKHPQVDSFIDDFLPPLLMLIDDHESYHRSLGLAGMTHMIMNSNSSVLRWYNRSEVIYDAIKHLIHSDDVSIITSLHPCVLSLLPILNGPPPVSIDTPQKPNRTDEVFCDFLGCMEMESKLAVRKALSSFLPSYIELMGIFTIRYLKRILSIIYSYIEYPDYCGEDTRLNSVQSLKVLIKHCWPRIPGHSHEIFKSILKLISDLSPNESIPEKPDVLKLIPVIKHCLQLLLLCCDAQMKKAFEEMLVKCNNHTLLHECIHAVLEEYKLKQL